MKKIFIFSLILCLFSQFSEGKENFIIKNLNADQYDIEAVDTDCKGLHIKLRKDKFLKDWAYDIIENQEIVDQSSFGEEKFISCVIKSIKSSSDIIKGAHQIRIRFRIEFLNGTASWTPTGTTVGKRCIQNREMRTQMSALSFCKDVSKW